MKCKCEDKDIVVIKEGKYTKLICKKCEKIFKSLIDINNDFPITEKKKGVK